VSEPVAIEPLFARMHLEYAEPARSRGLALRAVPLPCEAISDRVLLEGMLRNLLRNALSYTQAGGRILLACRRSRAFLKLEVHDTGIGIPSDELDCIFDAFHRSSSTVCGGFGLGLFIVKRAADSLGHRIEVSTRPGHGSRFRIIMDAATWTQRPAPRPRQSRPVVACRRPMPAGTICCGPQPSGCAGPRRRQEQRLAKTHDLPRAARTFLGGELLWLRNQVIAPCCS
jgi:hypothetical protein